MSLGSHEYMVRNLSDFVNSNMNKCSNYLLEMKLISVPAKKNIKKVQNLLKMDKIYLIVFNISLKV